MLEAPGQLGLLEFTAAATVSDFPVSVLSLCEKNILQMNLNSSYFNYH